jgi:putative ABC transport system substrate-binding protein
LMPVSALSKYSFEPLGCFVQSLGADMRRREFITLIGGAAAWPLAARAQQPAMSVIGLLTATNLNFDQIQAIRKGLNEGGYFEGRNLAIISRSADGQFDRLPMLAADLVDSKVSVILAVGGPVPARAAKAATSTIPVVFAYGGDPVSDNLVTSFNRPGGNVTGVTFIGTILTTKKLELLREIAPDVTDIGLLVNPTGTLAKIQIKDMGEAVQRLGLRLHVANVSSQGEIDAAFAALNQLKVGALLVGTDPIFAAYRDQHIALTARYKIPAIYNIREYCEAGGLMSYGASLANTWSQAGIYVARILKGEKPADLPVVQPTKFELVINLKTAKAIGLTVPSSLLARADEVIE